MHAVPEIEVWGNPSNAIFSEEFGNIIYIREEDAPKAKSLVDQMVKAKGLLAPAEVLILAALQMEVWDVDLLHYYYEGWWPDLESYGKDLFPDTNPELSWFVDWDAVAKAALEDTQVAVKVGALIYVFNPYKEKEK